MRASNAGGPHAQSRISNAMGSVSMSPCSKSATTRFCAASSSICSCVVPTSKRWPCGCDSCHSWIVCRSLSQAASCGRFPAGPKPALLLSTTSDAVAWSGERKSASLTSAGVPGTKSPHAPRHQHFPWHCFVEHFGRYSQACKVPLSMCAVRSAAAADCTDAM
eukprot:3594799-Prymnesium_polylepis.1